jgi:hypothetical protein
MHSKTVYDLPEDEQELYDETLDYFSQSSN